MRRFYDRARRLCIGEYMMSNGRYVERLAWYEQRGGRYRQAFISLLPARKFHQAMNDLLYDGRERWQKTR